MPDILFHIPTRVIFGADTITRIGQIAAEYGERAFLVTEAILYESKVVQRIQDILDKRGTQYIVFDEVVPNGTTATVDNGVTLARGSHADVVIGLGGMRALSTAKCIAMTVPTESDMDDYLSGVQPQGEPLPYIEVPTTCRDHFLLTEEWLITDGRDRTGKMGRAQKGITKAVIMDPKLCNALPAKYTATSMMDTLLAAVEGFLSTRGNFLTDTWFLKAIEILGRSLGEAMQNPDDVKTRTNASMAGLLTGMGLSMSRTGIGTALSYAMNARFMVPKSWVSTILLPHVLEYAVNARGERIAQLARFLGEQTDGLPTVEAAGRTVEAVRRLISSLNLPTRLRDFDMSLDEMIEIAGVARSYDMMNYLPRAAAIEDLYEMIKAAF
jgi:alcohol dehydrogenase